MSDTATQAASPAKARDWSAIALNVGLAVCAAVFIWQLPFFAQAGNEEFVGNMVFHAYVIAWMLIVTVLGRTLPLRVLAAAFFVGVFPSMALALFIGFPVGRELGTDSAMFDTFFVPILEEAVKLGPIILFFWWLTRRGRWQPSISDGLLLGFMVGAGFAIHEDALYARVYADGFEGDYGAILPTVGEGVTIFRQTIIGLYHSGWTALTGMAVAAWFLLRHRSRFAFLIPTVAIVIVLLDHGLGNYVIAMRDLGALDVLWKLDLEGRLPIYLLLAGVVATVVLEFYVMRVMTRRDFLFIGVTPAAFTTALQAGGTAAVQRVQSVRVYARARRSVHYWIWARGRSSNDQEAVQAKGQALAQLGDAAGLRLDETKSVEIDPTKSAATP